MRAWGASSRVITILPQLVLDPRRWDLDQGRGRSFGPYYTTMGADLQAKF